MGCRCGVPQASDRVQTIYTGGERLFTCKTCGLVSTDVTLFVTRSDRPKGVRNVCRQCNKSSFSGYQKKSRDKKRAALDALKSVPCVDCGVMYPPYVMDFDHLGDKSFNIGSEISQKKLKDLLDEAAKCEVVCSNCHRIRTHQRRVGII